MTNPNPVDTLYLDYRSLQEAERERDIVTARKYHEGEQIVPLTERMRKVLGIGLNATSDLLFRMNVTRSVVTAVSERLIVSSFDAQTKETIAWANNVWADNRMPFLQDDVHEGSLRDSEYFVIVDWDKEEQRPRLTPHQRYTSVQSGGDGYGCLMVYPGNDPNQKPLYAIKVWQEEESTGDAYIQREYRTIYYPDRLEKYKETDTGKLVLLETIAMVDSEGKPLGIPVIHFQNKGLRLESWDAWPLQNAINKTFVDLLASADLTAFRIYVTFGFIPTSDGKSPAEDKSNWLSIEPGQLIGSTAKPTEASFEAIEPADLKPLIDLTEQTILWMAMVTDTPVNRFISTRQIASDKTLKEQEGPLLAKVRNRQLRFGASWIDCMKYARKLNNLYSVDKLDETERLVISWAEAQPSAEMDHITLLGTKKTIGIPDQQLWVEAGYTQEKIETMLQMKAEAQERSLANTKPTEGDNRDGNGTETATETE